MGIFKKAEARIREAQGYEPLSAEEAALMIDLSPDVAERAEVGDFWRRDRLGITFGGELEHELEERGIEDVVGGVFNNQFFWVREND